MQALETELLKIYRHFSPEIVKETFVSETSSYNLRSNDTFEKRQVLSVYHVTESLTFLRSKNMGFTYLFIYSFIYLSIYLFI